MLRVVFMGTPEFAVPTLEALHDKHEVVAVVSLADKPRGRGNKVSPTPVKSCAQKLGLAVYQPARVRDEAFLEEMTRLAPDVIVVAAYSRLIPAYLLNLPRLGCLNLHPSFLPRYRGAIPVPAAIMHGDKIAGVTVFRMDEGYDTGDLLMWKEENIGEDDTGSQLLERLSKIGAQVVLDTLQALEENTVSPLRQDDIPEGYQRGNILYTKPLSKDDLIIDWSKSAIDISNFVRALMDAPTATTVWQGEVLKVGKVLPFDEQLFSAVGDVVPGKIVHLAKGKGPVVATGDGYAVLAKVKPAGKGWMDGWAFVQGRHLNIGDIIGK